jgi:hypothetical protein
VCVHIGGDYSVWPMSGVWVVWVARFPRVGCSRVGSSWRVGRAGVEIGGGIMGVGYCNMCRGVYCQG